MPRVTVRLTQRTRLRLMAAATVGCAAVFSYVSTRNLGERLGFGWLSWLFPMCLDAGAAVGMELWLSGSPAQRPAKWLALAAITASLTVNFIDWRLAQNNWGSAVLGTVPPAMLALQLLVLHQHDAGQPRPRRATRPDTRSRTRPRAGTPRRGAGPKPAVPDADLLAQMRQVERDGGRLSKRFVMTTYHVGDTRALRLLDAHHNTPAKAEPAPHTNGAVLR